MSVSCCPLSARSHRRRAFTLPEVALALIVLALGITTAITALQRAFLNLDTARNLQVAAGILQCEIEKERLFSWAQVSDAAYQPVIDASFLRNPAVAGRFTLTRTLATVAQRSGQMVQVTVTVRWRSYDGRNLTRSTTTYFGQGGLYNYVYQNS
ncbi:MAG TPA: prepilin-type N-terminal cleavage/methylation domain-containing protein [Opitutaceae bacterium]|nr:prepilin-type N-terminal cleavage/methylation domain-containing protein [Opitutaceae bacterium]